MTRAGRKAMAALAAAITMVAGPANASDEPVPATDQREATLVLHIVNHAGVSRDVLDLTRVRVASVYEVIGVRTEWVEGKATVKQRRDGRLHLTIFLLSDEMTRKKTSAERIKDHVLGQAHAVSGRAYIFCQRIATMPERRIPLANPLADVIAHEVGHLVLPANRHSKSGIMRAALNVHDMQLKSFDKMQGRSIRSTLLD